MTGPAWRGADALPRIRVHIAALAVLNRGYALALKFNPAQPRVPAGSPAGGQWTSGDGSETTLRKPGSRRRYAIVLSDPQPGPLSPDGNAQLIPVANRPRYRHVWLGNIDIPNDGIDPLDPAGLNQPLPWDEGQVVAETYDIIKAGNVFDVAVLHPHSYKNFPEFGTGAMLPPSINGYMSYDVLWPGESDRGLMRLVIENRSGVVYYTNNHYKSFRLLIIKHS